MPKQEIIIHIVDLRKADINQFLSSPYLSEEDLDAVKEFKMEEMREEKLISRYFKNKYVGEYYLGEHGKPLSKNICFNISHSHGVIIFASSNKDIGVDIEMIKEVEDKLVDYVTTDEEKEYASSLEKFFEVWTLKESLLKADGCGIAMNLKEISTLPVDEVKEFNHHRYQSKLLRYDNYVIALSINLEEEIEVRIKEEL